MISPLLSATKANQRYAILEAALERFSLLTTSQIAHMLGISKGHTGRVLRAYRKTAPDNVLYVGTPGARGWKRSGGYARRFLAEDQDAQECLVKYWEVYSIRDVETLGGVAQ